MTTTNNHRDLLTNHRLHPWRTATTTSERPPGGGTEAGGEGTTQPGNAVPAPGKLSPPQVRTHIPAAEPTTSPYARPVPEVMATALAVGSATAEVGTDVVPVAAQPGQQVPGASVSRRAPALSPRQATLDLPDLVRRPRAHPTRGWRGAAFAATRGRWNPGLSALESERARLIGRARTQLAGWHSITVSSMKGGIGKTTVAAGLGLTLAEHRGDRIVALDANPDAGTLADRLTGHCGITVRELLDNIDTVTSWTDMAHYTSLAGRLQVLASEQDPAMSEAFNRAEYEQICAVLARFYNIIITDSGTGLVHSAMEGTLALADSLIVVGSPTVDGASRASKTLDWLVAHGFAEQVADAVVVLSCDRVSPEIDRERVRTHFRSRARA